RPTRRPSELQSIGRCRYERSRQSAGTAQYSATSGVTLWAAGAIVNDGKSGLFLCRFHCAGPPDLAPGLIGSGGVLGYAGVFSEPRADQQAAWSANIRRPLSGAIC